MIFTKALWFYKVIYSWVLVRLYFSTNPTISISLPPPMFPESITYFHKPPPTCHHNRQHFHFFVKFDSPHFGVVDFCLEPSIYLEILKTCYFTYLSPPPHYFFPFLFTLGLRMSWQLPFKQLHSLMPLFLWLYLSML